MRSHILLIAAIVFGSIIGQAISSILRRRRWNRIGPTSREFFDALVCLKYGMLNSKREILAVTVYASGQTDFITERPIDAKPNKKS